MASINEIFKTELFSYTVIRKNRLKTASLQVSPSNEVSIIVPKDLPTKKIEAVIRQKTLWILSKIKFNQEVIYPHKPKEFVSGESFQYLGRNYRLKIIKGGNKGLELKNGRFIVTLPQKTPDPEETVRALLVRWYIKHAEIKLKERASRFKSRLGVSSYLGIKIKSLKQRWGSCTKGGIININWRIIIAPINIVDYVIVHELCHRLHHDHSREFWKLIGSVIPDYRERKEWLRVNGAMLGI